MHDALIARLKDFPNGDSLMRAFVWPWKCEQVDDLGKWVKIESNVKENDVNLYYSQIVDEKGDLWDKISANYDYCILGGRWANEDHPCIDTYKNILKWWQGDEYCYAITSDFSYHSVDYPQKENLWNDDDLVYVMDAHR